MPGEKARKLAEEMQAKFEKELQQAYLRGYTAGFLAGAHRHPRPEPCTKNMPWVTVKDFFQKLNEEVDEFKEEVLRHFSLKDPVTDVWGGCTDEQDKRRIAEEGADVSTVIASFCEQAGIGEQIRDEEQEHVNAHNHERGRN